MNRYIHLDVRLSLAYDLYDPCKMAADVGTDHAHLPAALLQRGRCQHMILTELSPDALDNARDTIIRYRLSDRVSLRLGDGIRPVDEPCGMISVTGMGGRTIREILLGGQDRLQGASLLLSAHTDLPLIREAVREIGYRLDREEPCFCAGRYYLVIRARPGKAELSDREIRLGGPLFESASPQLLPYLWRRCDVLRARLRGLLSAGEQDRETVRQLEEDIAFYEDFIRRREGKS